MAKSNYESTVGIYTDGSCMDNPGGMGGWAFISMSTGNLIKSSGFCLSTTNQRMEMTAVIMALHSVKGKNVDVQIFPDSAYVVNCFKKKWYQTWCSNGFKTSTGKDVANQDLWKEMFDTIAELSRNGCDVTITKVPAHSNCEANNECDRMAKDVIRYYKNIIKK